MKFPIAVEPGNETTAYGVIFPDVPGCHSAGDTLDEAVNNALEALEGWLELCVEDDEELPVPGKLEEHQKNPEYEGFVFSFVDVDMTAYMGKAQKINVTLPSHLIVKIDKVVESNPKYKNRSAFLATAAFDELQTA